MRSWPLPGRETLEFSTLGLEKQNRYTAIRQDGMSHEGAMWELLDGKRPPVRYTTAELMATRPPVIKPAGRSRSTRLTNHGNRGNMVSVTETTRERNAMSSTKKTATTKGDTRQELLDARRAARAAFEKGEIDAETRIAAERAVRQFRRNAKKEAAELAEKEAKKLEAAQKRAEKKAAKQAELEEVAPPELTAEVTEDGDLVVTATETAAA